MYISYPISFCVITNGKRIKKIRKLLQSITKLNVPIFEVIICGKFDKLSSFSEFNIKYIEDVEAADKGLLGRMRNNACRNAKYDILVITDDDVIFHKSFYKKLCKVRFEKDFDVLCTRFLNPDGSRFWDWAVYDGIMSQLINYNETNKDIYITGGRCILKSHVFKKVSWDDELGFYCAEDVDFSNRIKDYGFEISFSKELVITHNDWRYTQKGKFVRKLGFFKLLISNSVDFLKHFFS